jgi:hypothetical protein
MHFIHSKTADAVNPLAFPHSLYIAAKHLHMSTEFHGEFYDFNVVLSFSTDQDNSFHILKRDIVIVENDTENVVELRANESELITFEIVIDDAIYKLNSSLFLHPSGPDLGETSQISITSNESFSLNIIFDDSEMFTQWLSLLKKVFCEIYLIDGFLLGSDGSLSRYKIDRAIKRCKLIAQEKDVGILKASRLYDLKNKIHDQYEKLLLLKSLPSDEERNAIFSLVDQSRREKASKVV